jgi:hypothetical protein
MDFNKPDELIALIESSMGKEYNQAKAEKYAAYCWTLKTQQRSGTIVNPWMAKKQVEQLDRLFRQVTSEGLFFDGVHVTLSARGISYDFQAYKNKMLLAYPESFIDLQLVYAGDTFDFMKESGKVTYRHSLSDPFSHLDKNVVGGYCVIKNKRGEFLTVLSSAEIQKHRDVAKTDNIWKQWFAEMCLKTIIRKACKYHFEDVFEGMNETDNDQYDLEQAGKPRVDVLKNRIVDLLETYQGDDKEQIRIECQQAIDKKTFDEGFAEFMVARLGGEI